MVVPTFQLIILHTLSILLLSLYVDFLVPHLDFLPKGKVFKSAPVATLFIKSSYRKSCKWCSLLFQSLVILARIVWGCCPSFCPGDDSKSLYHKDRCVRNPSWIAVMSHIPLQRPLGSWNAAWTTIELHVCRAWMPNSTSVLKQFYYIWLLGSHNFCCTWKNETTDPFMSTPVDKMPDI